jgi:hypothetical protein
MATTLSRALPDPSDRQRRARGGGHAAGRSGSDPAKPTFSTESDLVVLHVTVFDRHGDPVPQLPRDVFHVVEDGAPQTISMFSGEDAPVAVGLVVDNSSSMLTRRAMVMAGVMAFAESSKPDDQAFSIVFNEHVRRGLPPTVGFTSNATLLQASIAALPPGGMTALHDAVLRPRSPRHRRTAEARPGGAVGRRRQRQPPARGGHAGRAERSNALIYASRPRVSTLGRQRAPAAQARPRHRRRAYMPRTERDVVAAFADIAGKIRRGYTIGYARPTARTMAPIAS